MPFRKRGLSSVDICLASSTASVIATGSSISGRRAARRRDPGQVAVDHRHPVDGPALGVAGDQLVDPVQVLRHALDQADRVVQVVGAGFSIRSR
jgi:hypothetical protein